MNKMLKIAFTGIALIASGCAAKPPMITQQMYDSCVKDYAAKFKRVDKNVPMDPKLMLRDSFGNDYLLPKTPYMYCTREILEKDYLKK